MKNKQFKKFAVITGASSGFGREFARIFAREGHNVLLVSDAAKDLRKVTVEITKQFPVEARYLVMDLTHADAGAKIFQYLKKNHIAVSVLVNNAGLGNYGKFASVSLEKQRALLEVNMGILTELCHRVIPHMLKNKEGRILNVASMAAFQPGPYYATYYASKAYVLLLTEAIREEYKRESITISALCPGPSPTNFFSKAPMKDSSWVLRASMLPPSTVAELGYRGLMKGKDIIIPGLMFRLIPFGSRLLPRRLMTKISRFMVEIAARG